MFMISLVPHAEDLRRIICKPLEYIFRAYLNNESFPLEWKNTNAIPIQKKDDKQFSKNDRLISLLPPNMSESFRNYNFFNTNFKYLIKNNLISEKQSGFKPGVSCINQLKQSGISGILLNIIKDSEKTKNGTQ